MRRLPGVRSGTQRLAALLVAVLSASSPTFAQSPNQTSPPAAARQMPMKAMPGNPAMTGGSGAAGGSASDNGLMQAMDKMNQGMAAAPATGNVDQDFVAMMIPHHQGAVDMAKVELASGKDPFLRKLARNIIASQQRQIREMQAWQAKHPAKQ
jgi:uncharacterized protein (DUF305 family)